MIPGWWKAAAVLVVAGWLFLAGYWLKGVVEESEQADVLREQIKTNREAQERVNARAALAESQLAAERAKAAALNRKWSKIRETEGRSVCTLDDDTLGLLREARKPAGVPAR